MKSTRILYLTKAHSSSLSLLTCKCFPLLYVGKRALSTIEESSSVSKPAQQKPKNASNSVKNSVPPAKASHKSSKKASSSNAAKKTSINPDDSEDNTPFVELCRLKESSKKAPSYQADLNSCDHEAVSKKG